MSLSNLVSQLLIDRLTAVVSERVVLLEDVDYDRGYLLVIRHDLSNNLLLDGLYLRPSKVLYGLWIVRL